MRFVGIILSVLIIAVLAVVTTSYLSNVTKQAGLGSKSPVNAARSVKEQADLVTLQSSLGAYFAQNGTYPQTLDDLQPSLAAAGYSYTQCSLNSALVQAPSGSGFKLSSGNTTSFTKEKPESC